MDTPLPAQIRPIQQEAGQASEADTMELVEMILGALGRDALGLGSSIAHPRESEEWKSMTPYEKLEFFAPIWQIMRDENMTVEQVTWHCGSSILISNVTVLATTCSHIDGTLWSHTQICMTRTVLQRLQRLQRC